MEQELIQQPVIQYGFAGFSMSLLGIVVWLVTKVLGVVDKNTRALVNQAEVSTEMKEVLRGVKDSMVQHNGVVDKLKMELIRRPCLKEK